MKIHPPKLKPGDDVPYIITHQGAPIVNSVTVLKANTDLIAIFVDMKSKYTKVDFWFGGDDEPSGIYIHANKNSLKLTKGIPYSEPTRLQFVGLKAWGVFAASSGDHYTHRVCLIKSSTVNYVTG